MRRRVIWLSIVGASLVFSGLLIGLTPVFGRGDTSNIGGLTLGLDLSGGAQLMYRVVSPEDVTLQQDDYENIRSIVESRVSQFGVNEPVVQLLGSSPSNYRILVQIPGISNVQSVSAFYSSDLVLFNGEELVSVTESEFNEVVSNALVDAKYTLVDDEQTSLAGQRQFIVSIENPTTTTKDVDGEVLIKGDADLIKDAIEQAFPVSMDVLFRLPEGATETVQLPQLSEIESIFEENNHSEVEIIKVDTPSVYATSFSSRIGQPIDSENDLLIHFDIVPNTETLTLLTGTNVSLPENLANILNEIVEIPSYVLTDIHSFMSTYTVESGIDDAKALIGSTARLEFLWRQCGNANDVPDEFTVEQWNSVRCTNPQYYNEVDANVSADDLTGAQAIFQSDTNQWAVNLEFNSQGEEDFFRATSNIVSNGDLLAIYLDGVQLVAPTASAGIQGGFAVITGNFSAEDARRIAAQLRSGSLPAELDLIQERLVDASLGSDVLSRSLIAAGIGIALLIAFLIAYYKVIGIVATITLIMYAVSLVALIKVIPVTLTLSGIAAAILSLGLAVDANILVAERIKEELRVGRKLPEAINAGFKRAWPSIRDSNVSTLVIAFVLFWFGDRLGVSIVQGFALTLTLGIILSLIFAYPVNRIIMYMMATYLFKEKNLYDPVVESKPKLLTEKVQDKLIEAGKPEDSGEDNV